MWMLPRSDAAHDFGRKTPADLTEEEIGRGLYTHNCRSSIYWCAPAASCASRTSFCGKVPTPRIHVTETLWPDFRREHLLEAIVAYQKRGRRFGGLKDNESRLVGIASG